MADIWRFLLSFPEQGVWQNSLVARTSTKVAFIFGFLPNTVYYTVWRKDNCCFSGLNENSGYQPRCSNQVQSGASDEIRVFVRNNECTQVIWQKFSFIASLRLSELSGTLSLVQLEPLK